MASDRQGTGNFGGYGFKEWVQISQGKNVSPFQGSFSQLSKLFTGYTYYFQEILWLVEQNFFRRLCVTSDWISLQKMQQAVEIQERAFQSGRQVHLGEILLQTYIINVEKIYSLVEKLGCRIVQCSACQKYYYIPHYEQEKVYSCLACYNLLQKTFPPQQVLIQGLRSNFFWPRPLIIDKEETHNNFCFLEPHRESDYSIECLDREIENLFEFLGGGIHLHENTQEYSIAASLIKKLENNHSDMEASVDGFFGLQELFWLLSQKIFARMSEQKNYLNSKQIKEALQIQKGAFAENKQFHLGEVLLQMYLLDEQQTYSTLKGTGNSILNCAGCKRYYCRLGAGNMEHLCPHCQVELKDVEQDYTPLMQSLRANFTRPIILNPVPPSPHTRFLFFAERKDYKPNFSLTRGEIYQAIAAYSREHFPGAKIDKRKTTMSIPAVPVMDESKENWGEGSTVLAEQVFEAEEIILPEKTIEYSSIGKKTKPEKEYIDGDLLEVVNNINLSTTEEDIYDAEPSARLSLDELSGKSKRLEKKKRGFAALDDDLILKALEAAGSADLEDSQIFLEPQTDDDESTGNIILDEKQMLEVLETPVKNTISTNASRRLRAAVPTQLEYIGDDHGFDREKLSFLPLLLIILATIAVGFLLSRPYFNKKAIEKNSKKNRPASSIRKKKKQKATIPRKEKIVKPEKEEHNVKKEEKKELQPVKQATKPSRRLANLLHQTNMSTEQIIAVLRSLYRKRKLTNKDIPNLKQLFMQPTSSKKTRTAVIYCLGIIPGEETTNWLQTLLAESSEINYKSAAVKSLTKLANAESKEIMLMAFIRESRGDLSVTLARSLAKISPESEDVYHNMQRKFEQMASESDRVGILKALAEMKIKQQTTFFVQIVSKQDYSDNIRKEALQALAKNSAGNGKQTIHQLDIIKLMVSDDLKPAIIQTIKQLSKKKDIDFEK